MRLLSILLVFFTLPVLVAAQKGKIEGKVSDSGSGANLSGVSVSVDGNKTIVDDVQVSYANDDSFEWFGGTVNCTHLISFRTLDDDFDTDNGFSGKVQFGISLRDSAVADISKSEAFESDNDAAGSSLLPQTAAVFSNMTVMGPRATLANTGNSYSFVVHK